MRMVYFFGNGKAEGEASMKELLGGKGSNLAEMTNIGIPVPPGFTITTEVCDLYLKNKEKFPEGLREQVLTKMKELEEASGKIFGDPANPLLVSVRSGAASSMPGMMDTILNLGLNQKTLKALADKGNERFVLDAYRRFIQMFGDVVMKVDHDKFEHILNTIKKKKKVKLDTELNAEDLKNVVQEYKKIYKESTKEDFPEDPLEQLWKSIEAVFRSWNNPRAKKYRELHGIKGLKGTAVNVQAMVFGNLGGTSGTGVCFTRDPSTGENVFYGEYLMNAQGEDVVAGIRTPETMDKLKEENPKIYQQLADIRKRLEEHYRDMQDIEFTIEEGKLFILQTRTGKRTGKAAVKIAVDMAGQGLISREKAILRVEPQQLDQLLHPMIDPAKRKGMDPIAKGLNASPGAASGQIVFTAEDAETKWHEEGWKVLLVRKETSPEDIGGMNVSQGILTATGGMTSHAAVVARGMGKPCIAGCRDLIIKGNTCEIGGKAFREGDFLTIDGSTGEVFEGRMDLVDAEISGSFGEFLEWVDAVRKSAKRPGLGFRGIGVFTNADTPKDASVARKLGAEGIGLCRTEHMFFEEDRIDAVREMILAETREEREKALKKILPMQKKDFIGLFKAMDGLPVTIRLLDPPLHEFVPHTDKEIKELSEKLNVPFEKFRKKADSLKEFNPMLGHRGCRLGITYEEIYEMQVRAILEAATEVKKEGVSVHPEIMIPLIGTWQELSLLRKGTEQVAEKVFSENGGKIDYKIGTMIEIPRAALTADKIAKEAEFFSFGTNDLTQMTFGYSRDDAGVFLPEYVNRNILEHDPFQILDQEGVGQLVLLGIERGRKTRPDLKVGICGEHGGEPKSVEFCYKAGMNYVSCSPYRVPIARLAAAQAVLRHKD